jgi:hypothetical protein
MKPYPWTAYFTDIGKLIKSANLGATMSTGLEAEKTVISDLFDDDADDVTFASSVIRAVDAAISSGASAARTLAGQVSNYLGGVGRGKLESSFTTRDDLIDDLVAKMNDAAVPQSVKGINVSVLPAYVEAGDGGNQLSGYDLIRGIKSDNVDASGILYVEIVDDGGGFRHVDLYNDAAKGAGDLVGHTGTYNAPGTEAITEDNSSGVYGLITVDAVGAVDSITVTFSFEGIRTGNGTLSAWEATQMALDEDDIKIECSSIAGGAGNEIWTVTSAERGAASVTCQTGVAWPGASNDDELGIEFTITAGGVDFAVGDIIQFQTRSNDDGVFQTFFRDHFAKVLPFELDASETIGDALAT